MIPHIGSQLLTISVGNRHRHALAILHRPATAQLGCQFSCWKFFGIGIVTAHLAPVLERVVVGVVIRSTISVNNHPTGIAVAESRVSYIVIGTTLQVVLQRAFIRVFPTHESASIRIWATNGSELSVEEAVLNSEIHFITMTHETATMRGCVATARESDVGRHTAIRDGDSSFTHT